MNLKSRQQMAAELLDVVTGQETQASFEAQADVLATGIGGTCHLSGLTLTQTLEFFDQFSAEMRQHIEVHWGQIKTNTH